MNYQTNNIKHMLNNQKELTLQNLYDVVIRIDNKLDSSFGILSNRIQDLDIKIDSSIKASEERMKTSIDQEFDSFAIMIGKSFAGSEERMKGYVDSRFDKVETRLDRIELSTPRELEKRIMVVEEDSDLHDLYFRGFRETLKVA